MGGKNSSRRILNDRIPFSSTGAWKREDSPHATSGRYQVNAAIVYLTRNKPIRRIYLQSSLYFLFRGFNARYGYPVLIFHQGDFTDDAITAIRDGIPGGLGSLIHFKIIDNGDFKPPASAGPGLVRANRIIVPEARGVGYRSMCRWWVRHLPKYLEPYEFYMRLDDDSFIEEQLDYDPFRVVRDANVDYASNLIHVEHPLNALGLESFSRGILGEDERTASLFLRSAAADTVDPEKLARFALRVPVSLRKRIDTDELSTPIIYYNNFHVARTSLWANPAISRYFTAIDHSGGIYHLRWGDAALHTVALTAVKNVTLGRFGFRYSKRYEREQGSYVNTDHSVAKRYFDAAAALSTRNLETRTGSMTDFKAFNDLLATRDLSDLARLLP